MDFLKFFLLQSPDDKGRMLSDMLEYSYYQLESKHDFIQRMFPLKEKSKADPSAPLITDIEINAIKDNKEALNNINKAFSKMFGFYGLTDCDACDVMGLRIGESTGMIERFPKWLKSNNHNYLRITRILKFLKLVGMDREAEEFFKILTAIYKVERESPWL